jgi:hypothetical protein
MLVFSGSLLASEGGGTSGVLSQAIRFPPLSANEPGAWSCGYDTELDPHSILTGLSTSIEEARLIQNDGRGNLRLALKFRRLQRDIPPNIVYMYVTPKVSPIGDLNISLGSVISTPQPPKNPPSPPPPPDDGGNSGK